MRHIAVIDPGTRVPELDCFNRLARACSLPLTYHLPALCGVDSLVRSSDELAGVVILGSGASVHDGEPWQEALDAWLLPRVEAAVPVLGLCYGHQHLADRLGGEVDWLFEDRHKLKGLRTVSLDPDPLWGGSCSGPLVVSHSQVVTRLPEGFVVRGRTPGVGIEAFSHPSRPIWGFQAHPEATVAFTRNNDVPFEEDPSLLEFGHGLVDAFLARASR